MAILMHALHLGYRFVWHAVTLTSHSIKFQTCSGATAELYMQKYIWPQMTDPTNCLLLSDVLISIIHSHNLRKMNPRRPKEKDIGQMRSINFLSPSWNKWAFFSFRVYVCCLKREYECKYNALKRQK